MKQLDVVIEELLWDDWNTAHIARHNVTPYEVEQSLIDEDVVFLRANHGRIMVLGRAGKRLISTILNEQEPTGVFYVITARDMAKKERALYRAQRGEGNGKEQDT